MTRNQRLCSPWAAARFVLAVAGVLAITAAVSPAAEQALPAIPADYFAEPKDLPFDEEVLATKDEDGWRWKEFFYTSLRYQDQPIRVHALYAVPANASAQRKVPVIVATHGKFGAFRSRDPRYWNSIQQFAKAGYAVLFYDWNPQQPGTTEPHTTYGKIDYFTPEGWDLKGNDWKEGLFYQETMIGRRGISWLLGQPEVDGAKIAVWGCSYGGIFSSLLGGVDPRVTAINSVVYTSVFGKDSPGYSGRPRAWTNDELSAWRARFDSSVWLARRTVPILYTIGTNDAAFDVRHAMKTYALMNQPKTLLMGPRETHGFWAMDQTIRFFDATFKGAPAFASVESVQITRNGHHISARVRAKGNGRLAVRFFSSAVYQIDQVVDTDTVLPPEWTWTEVTTRSDGSDSYSAQCNLPRIDPGRASMRLYCWKCGREISFTDRACPADGEIQPEPGRGLFRIFAQVTDARGAVACSPLSEVIQFADSELPADATTRPSPGDAALPAVAGVAAALPPGTTIKIQSNVADGQAMAELPSGLPRKQVGTRGYALFQLAEESAPR